MSFLFLVFGFFGFFFGYLCIRGLLSGKKPVLNSGVSATAFCLAAQVGVEGTLPVTLLWLMGVVFVSILVINVSTQK